MAPLPMFRPEMAFDLAAQASAPAQDPMASVLIGAYVALFAVAVHDKRAIAAVFITAAVLGASWVF